MNGHFKPDADGVYAKISASPARRLFAVAVLYVLGALLVWTALAQPPAIGWAILLIAAGASALMVGETLRRATQLVINLYDDRIEDSAGTVLARLEDIASIERGVFAFKPSNGFLIVLKQPGTRVWRPGLWWRFGKRVGVGGVTPSGQAKFMAEQIAFRLLDNDA